MTRENFISKERRKKSPTCGHVTKLFLEAGFHYKRNKKMKKRDSKQNLAAFSAAKDSEHKMS